MAAIDLKSLVGKLDEHCRRALEAAAGLTLSRSHYNVELEHWLLKLVDGNGTDLPLFLRHYDLDEGRFRADLNASLDKMRTGNARAPGLSPDIIEMVKQAWLLASVEQGLQSCARATCSGRCSPMRCWRGVHGTSPASCCACSRMR